jgi:serine/threonine-protein kinase
MQADCSLVMAEQLAHRRVPGVPGSAVLESSGPSGPLVDSRYRLLDRLGSGGSAAVYRAEDLLLHREVAIKLLHRCFADDGEVVARFRREASSAALFDHEHIVSVYGSGQWGGTRYIAMEYLGGRSLRSIIQREAPLAELRAIDLTTQVLRAAGSVHGRGIVHRDLKPDNAILDGSDRLKITDFGIARTGVEDITHTGSMIGTVHYVSPEQAQGKEAGPASDLYSIGVILYELLTARVPFEGETVVAVLQQHINERPPAPSTFNALIPPQLDAIVMKALEKQPSCRFADAEAFITALDSRKRWRRPWARRPLRRSGRSSR